MSRFCKILCLILFYCVPPCPAFTIAQVGMHTITHTFTQLNLSTLFQVQIRPWSVTESDFVMDKTQPIDPRKTIFVGGVPRPLRAQELAQVMEEKFGSVCYAGIDVDPDLKYPKGKQTLFINK